MSPFSSSRSNPSHDTDPVSGSQLQENENSTSFIDQPQTINAVVDRTHIITTGLLAKLSSTATGFSQTLSSSRDQHQRTHHALKEILRDFQASMITGSTKPRTGTNPIEDQLNKQIKILEQEMLSIDTQRENLVSALEQGLPAHPSRISLTYRAGSGGRSSRSNPTLGSFVPSQKRQGSPQAGPSPKKAKSLMAVFHGPGTAEDAPVRTSKKKSIRGQANVSRAFSSQLRRASVTAEEPDSLEDILDDVWTAIERDEIFSPPGSPDGTGA